MFGTRMSAFLKISKRDLKHDLPASIVVFLVALPLCLGIAMASGAPLFAGILTGIIGGIVVSAISKSPLSVSGPAAGLTVIILGAIQELGAYETFLLAVLLAGVIQFLFGIIKAGIIGNYFPSAVILGMLAAIGLTIILKQIPLAFGITQSTALDLAKITQFSNMGTALLTNINWGATLICGLSLAILIYWPSIKKLNQIPAPLVVVLVGLGLGYTFQGTSFALIPAHYVSMPVVSSLVEFKNLFIFPDFSQILNQQVWIIAFTIAIVASLETLLSIEAIDKIDPFKRNTPTNRELIAQGLGNMGSGLLGGLPMTSVIVRSSANVGAGGRTRQSAMLHGLWLLVAVLVIPGVLNLIPLAALAAILIHTGYKLAKPMMFKKMYTKGLDQFIPFTITVVAIVMTDLLVGVGVGILVATFYILKANMRNSFQINISQNQQEDSLKAILTLPEEVSFLNKAPIQEQLYNLPKGVKSVYIDGHKSKFIDKDVIDVLKDYELNAINKGIAIELYEVNYKARKKRKKQKNKKNKELV